MDRVATGLRALVDHDPSLTRLEKWGLRQAIGELPQLVTIMCSDVVGEKVRLVFEESAPSGDDDGAAATEWATTARMVDDLRAALCRVNQGAVATMAQFLWSVGDAFDRGVGEALPGMIEDPHAVVDQIWGVGDRLARAMCSDRFRAAVRAHAMIRLGPELTTLGVGRIGVLKWNSVVRGLYMVHPRVCGGVLDNLSKKKFLRA